MSRKGILFLMMMVMASVVWGQSVQDFTMTTGTDASKWVTVTNTTNVFQGQGDNARSSVLDIGFDFPFGGQTYSQFSVNSDGNLRLGSTQVTTSNAGTPFSSTNANNNNPKINFFGCDGYANTDGYAYYQLFGEAPNRYLVVEIGTSTYNSTTRNVLYRWQIHLYENGEWEAVYPGEQPSAVPNVYRQIGACVDKTDGFTVSSSNYLSPFSEGSSVVNSYYWPDNNRYYHFTPSTCDSPKQIQVAAEGLTTTTATITWTGTAGSYQVWYGAKGFSLSGSGETVTTNSKTLEGLTANTEYDICVRSICGAGNASAIKRYTFSTPPETITTLPYSCDFESAPYNEWSMVNGSLYTKWDIGSGTNSTLGSGGSNALYVRTSADATHSYYGSNTSIFAYAVFLLEEGQYTLSYDWIGQGEGTVDFMRVALVPWGTELVAGTSAPSEWYYYSVPGTPLDGGSKLNLQSEWTRHTEIFDVETTGSYMMVFYWRNNNSGTYQPPAAVDNIELSVVTCPFETTITVSDQTTTSATLSWTAGSAAEYEVEYGPEGFAVGSGTKRVVSATTTELTGLQSGTYYDVYISSVCGSGDVSLPVKGTFHTNYEPISTLPYTCDFEGHSGDIWQFDVGEGLNHWIINTSTSNGGNRSLYVSNSTYNYYFNKSNYSQSCALLPFHFEEGLYQLAFDWKCPASSSYTNPCVWLVSEDEWNSTHSVYNGTYITSLNTVSSWIRRENEFTVSTPGNYYIVFYWFNSVDNNYSNSTYPGAVDNVEVTTLCPYPLSLTTVAVDMHSATFSWSGEDGTFDVQYGLYGANWGDLEHHTVTDKSYTVSELTNGTKYQFGVSRICGEGDISQITYTYFTTTPMTAGSVPYSCDFEGDMSGEWFLVNTDEYGNTLTNRWFVGTAAGSVDGGSQALYVSDDEGVTHHYTDIDSRVYAVKLLSFDAGIYKVGFDWKAGGDSYYDWMRVGLVPIADGYDACCWNRSNLPGIALDGGSALYGSSNWQHLSNYVNVEEAGDYYLIVCWNNYSYGLNQPPAAIDNITIESVVPATVPYICDFEGGVTDGWLLNNSTSINKWCIGSAVNHTTGGSNALYISDDGGTTNHYITGTSFKLFAINALTFEAGAYSMSYSWRSNGDEYGSDWMRVGLVPATQACPTCSWSSYSRPSNSIALDGDIGLYGSADWQQVVTDFNITMPGVYYLIFIWSNNSSSSYQPPAAIDDIVISPIVPHTIPYTCDFEAEDNSDWFIKNDIYNTQWHIGSATNNTTSGSKALYVSGDGGATNTYNGGEYPDIYAYTMIDCEAGLYYISYDWKAGGSGGSGYANDYLRVALIPMADGYNNCCWSNNGGPNTTPGINLDGEATLYNVTDWTTHEQEFEVATSGTYLLVFYWANSSYSSRTQPPAAIDNIIVRALTCPTPNNLAASVTNGSLQLTWTPRGTESSWRVNDGAVDHVVFTPSFNIADALPAYTYNFTVTALCSGTEESLPASYSYKTDFFCNGMADMYTTDETQSTDQSARLPISNGNNYSISEIIIEESELTGANYISAVAFYYEPYDDEYIMTAKNDVDIYLMSTTLVTFESSYNVPLANDAVLVYSGSLNCVPGWNYFSFGTPYLYGGGNLMMVFNDKSGDYNSSSYCFRTRYCSDNKAWCYTSGYSPFSDISYFKNYSGSRYTYRPEMRLISCGSLDAAVHHITVGTIEHGSVTLSGSDIASGNYVLGGSEITITATPDANYNVGAFTVNGVEVTSPHTMTVSGDVTVEATFVPTAPDLHIVSLTHTEFVAGQEATITWTVRNDGTAATPEGITWTDYLYFSSSPNTGSSQQSFNYSNTQALGVGESYTQTLNITVPDIAGDYYLIVSAKEQYVYDIECPEGATYSNNNEAPYCTARYCYSSGFAEITSLLSPDRHDNFLIKPVTITEPARPDLHVTSISHTTLVTGQEATITYTVRNDGTAATPEGNWPDFIFISHGPSLEGYSNSSCYELGSWTRSEVLAPGESYTKELTVTIPDSYGGDQYIIVVSKYWRSVYNVQCPEGTVYDGTTNGRYCTSTFGEYDYMYFREQNESLNNCHDNFLIKAVEVLEALPDLHVANLTVSSTATEGTVPTVVTEQSATVTFTIRNDGTTATPSGTSWTDYLYMSKSPNMDVYDDCKLITSWSNKQELGVGESYTRTADVTIPAWGEGTCYLILVTNNSNRLYNIQCPDGATVETNGSEPYCTSAGAYSDGSGRSFVELHEMQTQRHDNFLVTAVNVDVQLPDLHVASLTHSQLVTGQQATINFTVRNDGNVATHTQWYDNLYLATTPGGSDYSLGSWKNKRALNAGGDSYEQEVTVTIPSNVSGDMYLTLVSNKFYANNIECPEGVTAETNGSSPYCTSSASMYSGGSYFTELNEPQTGRHDNFIVKPVTILVALPDLHVTTLEVISENGLVTGKHATVRWTVQNDGTSATPSDTWYDRLYLCDDPNNISSTSISLGSWARVNALGVGESYTNEQSVSIPIDAAGEKHLVLLTAKSGYSDLTNIQCPDGAAVTNNSTAPYCTAIMYSGAFNELYELETGRHDNFLVTPATVRLELPELHVVEMSHSALSAGRSCTVRWKVRNDGTSMTPSGTTWTDYLYISSSPEITYNGEGYTLLGSWNNVRQLNYGGDSYQREVTVTIPESYGNEEDITYYLIVTTDAKYVYNIECPQELPLYEGIAQHLCTARSFTQDYDIGNDRNKIEELNEYGTVQAVNVTGNYNRTWLHDNFLIEPVHVPLTLKPNLHAVDFTTSNIVAGHEASFTWTIRNEGPIATYDGAVWYDYIYLTSDPDQDNGAILGTWENLAALDVEEEYTRSVTVDIPQRITTGTMYLILFCNRDHDPVLWGSQFDSIIKIPVEVELPPLPDLQVDNIVPPGPFTSGSEVDVQAWMINRSEVPTTSNGWTDELWVSNSPTFRESTARLIDSKHHDSPSPLEESEGYHVNFHGKVPVKYWGNVYFHVTVNADGGEFESLNGANNTSTSAPVTVALGGVADLVVTNVTVPTEASNRKALKVKYSVTNKGTAGPDSSMWFDYVYLTSAAPQVTQYGTDASSSHRFAGKLKGLQRNGNQLCTPVVINFDWDNNPVYECEWNELEEGQDWFYPLGAMFVYDDSIKAEEHYTKELELGLPDFLATGDYYIVVAADGGEAVYEYCRRWQTGTDLTGIGDSNNMVWKPMHFTRHQYDFTPTDLTIPANVVQGYGTHMWVTVNNVGGLDFEGPLSLSIYYSSDPTLTYDNDGHINNATKLTTFWETKSIISPLSSSTVGSSGMGSDVSVYLKQPYAEMGRNITFPTDLLDGDYYLYVVIDKSNYYSESSYDNNIVGGVPFHLCHDCPMPDVAVSNVEIPDVLVAGKHVTIEFDMTNHGTVALNGSALYTALYLSNDNGETWTWCPVKHQYSPDDPGHPNTPSGYTWHYKQTVVIPPDLEGGDYIARLRVDVENAVAELDEEDNIFSKPVTVMPNSLTITVENNDVSPVINKVTRRMALDGGNDVITVRAEETFNVSWQTDLTNATPAYRRIDKHVLESDVQGYKDAIFYREVPGEQDNTAWVDAVYFSDDAILSDDDKFLGRANVPYTKVCTPSYYNYTSITLEEGEDGQAYDGYLIFVVDASNSSFELDRTDNLVARPIHVLSAIPPADLTITAATLPEEIHQGDNLIVEFTVTNIGEGTALGSWQDHIFNGDFDELFTWVEDPYNKDRMIYVIDFDKSMGSVGHSGPLAPGESYTVRREITFPYDETYRPHSLTIWTAAKVSGKFRDANSSSPYSEGNDTYSEAYELLPATPTDLVISNVQVDKSTIVSGDEITVTWNIANIGYNTARGVLRDGVYLSRDEVIDNDDYLIGQLSGSVNIATQTSIYRSATFAVQGVPEGEYHVIVRANMPNAFAETSFDNNRAMATGLVHLSLPSLVINVEEVVALASGQQVTYRMDVPAAYAGKTLQLSAVTDKASTSYNGIYIAYSYVPTVGRHDYGTQMPYVEKQEVLMPKLKEGTYYILVTATTADESEQNLTLLAKPIDFSILTIDANEGGNTGSISTKVRGAMFQEVMDFRLVKETLSPDGMTGTVEAYYPAERVNFKDATQSFVTFNLTDMAPGTYTVEGELPGGEVKRLLDGFTIVDGLPGDLYYKIYAPDEVRTDQNVEITVEYGNSGKTDIEVAGFLVVSYNNHPIRRERPFTIPEIIEMNQRQYWPTEVTFSITEAGMDDDIIRPGHAGTMSFFIFANTLKQNDEIEFEIFPLQRRR